MRTCSRSTPAITTSTAPPPSLPTTPAIIAAEDDDAEQVAAPATAAVRTRLHDKPALVNVRPEPGTGRAPVAVLKGGKVVEVLEEQEGWLKIRWFRKTGPVEGWVSRKFVKGYD